MSRIVVSPASNATSWNVTATGQGLNIASPFVPYTASINSADETAIYLCVFTVSNSAQAKPAQSSAFNGFKNIYSLAENGTSLTMVNPGPPTQSSDYTNGVNRQHDTAYAFTVPVLGGSAGAVSITLNSATVTTPVVPGVTSWGDINYQCQAANTLYSDDPQVIPLVNLWQYEAFNPPASYDESVILSGIGNQGSFSILQTDGSGNVLSACDTTFSIVINGVTYTVNGSFDVTPASTYQVQNILPVPATKVITENYFLAIDNRVFKQANGIVTNFPLIRLPFKLRNTKGIR